MQDLVELALNSDPELARTPNTPEGRARVADATRQRALAISQRFGGGGQRPPLRPVESGDRARGGRQQPAPSQEPAQPSTLSDILRQRRASREQARRGA